MDWSIAQDASLLCWDGGWGGEPVSQTFLPVHTDPRPHVFGNLAFVVKNTFIELADENQDYFSPLNRSSSEGSLLNPKHSQISSHHSRIEFCLNGTGDHLTCTSSTSAASAEEQGDHLTCTSSASATSAEELGQNTTVWIGQLPTGIEELDLKNELEKCGYIKSINLRKGKNSFAFVEFESERSMRHCVETYNCSQVFGGGPILVQVAAPKRDQQHQLAPREAQSQSDEAETSDGQPQSDEVDFSIEKAQLLHGQIVDFCTGAWRLGYRKANKDKELDVTAVIRQNFSHIDIEKYIPRDPVTGELESLGSVFHRTGNCKRCCFFLKNTCHKAELCLFCHAPHAEPLVERQRPSKRERLRLRDAARNRLNAETAVDADIDDVDAASAAPGIAEGSHEEAPMELQLEALPKALRLARLKEITSQAIERRKERLIKALLLARR